MRSTVHCTFADFQVVGSLNFWSRFRVEKYIRSDHLNFRRSKTHAKKLLVLLYSSLYPTVAQHAALCAADPYKMPGVSYICHKQVPSPTKLVPIDQHTTYTEW